MPKRHPSGPLSPYVSVSSSASVAVTGEPTSRSAGVFSSTLRVVDAPSENTGGALDVMPVPGSDQSPLPASLTARTRTWCAVEGDRPVIVVVVAAPE